MKVFVCLAFFASKRSHGSTSFLPHPFWKINTGTFKTFAVTYFNIAHPRLNIQAQLCDATIIFLLLQQFHNSIVNIFQLSVAEIELQAAADQRDRLLADANCSSLESDEAVTRARQERDEAIERKKIAEVFTIELL